MSIMNIVFTYTRCHLSSTICFTIIMFSFVEKCFTKTKVTKAQSNLLVSHNQQHHHYSFESEVQKDELVFPPCCDILVEEFRRSICLIVTNMNRLRPLTIINSNRPFSTSTVALKKRVTRPIQVAMDRQSKRRQLLSFKFKESAQTWNPYNNLVKGSKKKTQEYGIQASKRQTGARIPGTHIDNHYSMFKLIPEMVPEFVVPDLTDCELKPYVTYRAERKIGDEVKPYTKEQLFIATHAPTLVEEWRQGYLTMEVLLERHKKDQQSYEHRDVYDFSPKDVVEEKYLRKDNEDDLD